MPLWKYAVVARRMLIRKRIATLASTATLLRHFCYVTSIVFIEGVLIVTFLFFDYSNYINSTLRFQILPNVNALFTLMHSKIFSTDVCDLQHAVRLWVKLRWLFWGDIGDWGDRWTISHCGIEFGIVLKPRLTFDVRNALMYHPNLPFANICLFIATSQSVMIKSIGGSGQCFANEGLCTPSKCKKWLFHCSFGTKEGNK